MPAELSTPLAVLASPLAVQGAAPAVGSATVVATTPVERTGGQGAEQSAAHRSCRPSHSFASLGVVANGSFALTRMHEQAALENRQARLLKVLHVVVGVGPGKG